MDGIISRDNQREILLHLARNWPHHPKEEKIPHLDGPTYEGDIAYLVSHGLITAEESRTIGCPGPRFIRPAITAKGLDFLQQDGGLTAWLNAVHVRIDPDDLRDALRLRIEAGEHSPAEKTKLKKMLDTMSTAALSEVIKIFVHEGAGHLASAIRQVLG